MKRTPHPPFYDLIVSGINAGYAQMVAIINAAKNRPNQFSTGVFKYYYPTGQLKEEKTYEYGDLNGPYKEYFKSGQVQAIKIYKNNISINEHYYFENGKPAGEMVSYNGKDMTTESSIS